MEKTSENNTLKAVGNSSSFFSLGQIEFERRAPGARCRNKYFVLRRVSFGQTSGE